LRPLAGRFAFLLFSLGIIGAGLLAVPVLAGSSAFALAETFRWRRGLDLTMLRGARFYGGIAASTIVGVGLGFTHIDPIGLGCDCRHGVGSGFHASANVVLIHRATETSLKV
jgi:Mn2+/Fe2+ NRAMP family transporter